jgi:hypothetical protein
MQLISLPIVTKEEQNQDQEEYKREPTLKSFAKHIIPPFSGSGYQF